MACGCGANCQCAESFEAPLKPTRPSDNNGGGRRRRRPRRPRRPLGAEAGNPDKTTSTQYAVFYVGFEDDEGELKGGGKFKKFNDAKAKALKVAEREGNSRIVGTRGFALWTDDGKGMWQEGYQKADAMKFYSAEDVSYRDGFRMGFGFGAGLLVLSASLSFLSVLLRQGGTSESDTQED